MLKGITHFLFAILFAFVAGYATAGENNAQSIATATSDTLLLIAQKDEVFEKYCTAAIEDNDANAQFTLGLFYATGHAAKQDKHLAALLFYLAAEQQHKVALDWLMQVDGDPALANLPSCNKTLKRERTAFNSFVETSDETKEETESLSIHDINKQLTEYEQAAPPMKRKAHV